MEANFTIEINDVAEPPSNIYFVQYAELIEYAVEVYSPVGTVIGKFVAEYEDEWEHSRELSVNEFGFTFEFCSMETDEKYFAIVGNELVIA